MAGPSRRDTVHSPGRLWDPRRKTQGYGEPKACRACVTDKQVLTQSPGIWQLVREGECCCCWALALRRKNACTCLAHNGSDGWLSCALEWMYFLNLARRTNTHRADPPQSSGGRHERVVRRLFVLHFHHLSLLSDSIHATVSSHTHTQTCTRALNHTQVCTHQHTSIQ
jgi:hypothetical protein